MVLDPVMEKTLKRFNIDTEIKEPSKKYLSREKKWDICIKFFKDNYKNAQVLPNKKENLIRFIFDDEKIVREFSDNPSNGLLPFARKILTDEGISHKEYNISFNFVVETDEKNPNSKAITLRVF